MSQVWEYIKIALMNIRSNKGRSVLTMLGIIIGRNLYGCAAKSGGTGFFQ